MRRKKIEKERLKRMTPEEYAEYGKMKDLGRMDADAYKELKKNSRRRRDLNDTERNNSQIINNER